jgi:hypothetical protein
VVSVTRIQNKPRVFDYAVGIPTVPDTVITRTADGVTTVHTDPDPAIELVKHSRPVDSGQN